MLEINKIYNVDCVEGMRLMDEESVHLTVTSPPYDNLRTYKGFTFDFESTAKELFRVTAQGGVVVWVVGDATIHGSETCSSFRQALFFRSLGFNLHDTMIYKKNGTGACGSNLCYWQTFEYMFVFSKGKPRAIHLLDNGKPRSEARKCYGRLRKNGEKRLEIRSPADGKLQRRNNIWEYNVGFCASNCGSGHPAVFPEQLAQDHILSWSNEGDLVLDPFMGSGTTARMALLNNRNYIGFEIAKEYCDLAENRLAELNPS